MPRIRTSIEVKRIMRRKKLAVVSIYNKICLRLPPVFPPLMSTRVTNVFGFFSSTNHDEGERRTRTKDMDKFKSISFL